MRTKKSDLEREKFERWYSRTFFISAADMREMRSEAGYSSADLDFAWFGWSARARRS